MIDVMGVEHVACGFDFCGYMESGSEGAAGIEDSRGIPGLFAWLERMGMHAGERECIARENLLRLFSGACG